MPAFDVKEHLRDLVAIHAPSGYETELSQHLQTTWDEWVDEFDHDGMGSLIGIKRTTNPSPSTRKIMLAAHMDEIAMVVRDIVDGFIFVHDLAGVDERNVLAKPVIVHGKTSLPGVVAAKPPHFVPLSRRRKYPTFRELVVDVGLPADVVAEQVRIGDPITFDAPLIELRSDLVSGKALDNRASVAALSYCLYELTRMTHQWDVYAVATVQEELGLGGAIASANQIEPDLAVAIDVTFASQPRVNTDESFDFGSGVAIGIGANFHPAWVKHITDTADRYEIKAAQDVLPASSGTDAWAIQVANLGVVSGLVSMPIRSMHSPVETVSIKDIKRTGRLLAHVIADLEPDFIPTYQWSAEETTT